MASVSSANKATATAPQAAAVRHPKERSLINAFKTSQKYDNAPIQTDYWEDSINGSAVIVIRNDGSKILYKSAHERTSPIRFTFKGDVDAAGATDAYIILTANSVYIIDGKTSVRKMNMEGDSADDDADLDRTQDAKKRKL